MSFGSVTVSVSSLGCLLISIHNHRAFYSTGLRQTYNASTIEAKASASMSNERRQFLNESKQDSGLQVGFLSLDSSGIRKLDTIERGPMESQGQRVKVGLTPFS